MEQKTELRTLPDRPPRHCPACGARVAEGAKTCLMCGVSLEEKPQLEAASATEPSQRLTWKQIVILVVIAILILTGAVILGLNLSQTTTLPTPTPTITETPSPRPTSTVTPTPTMTPPPQPTPTPIPPESYTIREGDTLLSIAAEFDITVNELQIYNGLDSDIIVPGQALLIPPPPPTPGPTPTLDPSQPTPTFAPFLLHTVRSGDTLSTIAEQYGVSVQDIQAANGLNAESTVIQVNQVLQIPQFTPTPVLEEQIIVGGTPTPRSSYAPPTLLYPPENTSFTGETATIVLQWASVGILNAGETYRITFTAPAESGSEPETSYAYTRSTTWRVPETYFPPPAQIDRRCNWQVVVVRQIGTTTDPRYESIGKTSTTRTFTWDSEGP